MRPGTIVSEKYRVLEHLGSGGMGEVYRAEHELTGRVVALKLLREGLAQDRQLTQRFFREAQAVSRVNHPNIVDVLDAGFSEHGPYVAMEFLEGGNVATLLAVRGKLTLTQAISLAIPTLEALHAAHMADIVHRDIKPENLFLARISGRATVKLLDFGIAKVLSSGMPRTVTGIILGTPDYLSPEQASGEGIVDGRSDVFAMGAVFFELVTGQRPFLAQSAVATAYRIVHADPPRFEDLGLHGEPELQAVLDRALAKAPADRFASAAHFAEALRPTSREAREEALEQLLRALEEAPRPLALADRLPQPTTAQEIPSLLASQAPRHTTSLVGTLLSRDPPRSAPANLWTQVSGSDPRSPGSPASRPRSESEPLRLRTPSRTDFTRDRRPEDTSLSGEPPSSKTESPRPAPPRMVSTRPGTHAHASFHTRGSLPRAVRRWVVRHHGEAADEQILANLTPPLAEAFRGDVFNALVWYPIANIDAYMEAAAAVLGDVTSWRQLARDNFSKELAPIFRPSASVTDPQTLIARFPNGWARIFDFGALQATGASPHETELRIGGFEAASLALRYVVVGILDGMLRSAGVTSARVRIVSGEVGFARELELAILW